MISKCGSIANMTNKILNETLDTLGVKVDDTNSVTTNTDVAGTAKAESKNSGLFESLGKLFGGIFDGIISYIVLGVFGLIIFGIIIYLIFKYVF
jgi:hypothetical protein